MYGLCCVRPLHFLSYLLYYVASRIAPKCHTMYVWVYDSVHVQLKECIFKLNINALHICICMHTNLHITCKQIACVCVCVWVHCKYPIVWLYRSPFLSPSPKGEMTLSVHIFRCWSCTERIAFVIIIIHMHVYTYFGNYIYCIILYLKWENFDRNESNGQSLE